jgi:hypothetical protein
MRVSGKMEKKMDKEFKSIFMLIWMKIASIIQTLPS